MTRAPAPPVPEDVLRRISHGFASTTDPGEAVSATIGWVREALGDPRATVCIVLPDPAGRLRQAAVVGRKVRGGRLRSSRRRKAFETKRTVRVDIGQPPGQALQISPLVSRGEAVGVVEVVASRARLEERVEVLKAVVSLAAATIRNARDRRDAERALSGLGASVGLASELLRAGSRQRAMRVAAELSYEHLRVPLACWLTAAGEGDVAIVRGFGARKRAEVRQALRSAGSPSPGRAVASVRRALVPVLGFEPVIVRAGDAVVAVAGEVSEAGMLLLKTVAGLLGDALRTIGVVTEARAKSEGLDLGIALTAHELRGPLLGARAAIAHLVAVNDHDASTELLLRTKAELDGLASLVDPLLRWAAGTGRLHKRETDLVKIVREAIASCELLAGDEAVTLFGPEAMEIYADPKQLRTAVANLVRNALESSPDGVPVIVEVGRAHDVAWVSSEERELIFDAFARGRASVRSRSGTGLGLFITRRVVEAHDGTVRVLPTEIGATFRLELPIAERGRQPSAS